MNQLLLNVYLKVGPTVSFVSIFEERILKVNGIIKNKTKTIS